MSRMLVVQTDESIRATNSIFGLRQLQDKVFGKHRSD